MANEIIFPQYVVEAASRGALIGTILDSMETQHSRHIGENRSFYEQHPEQRPTFNRDLVRQQLLKQFPNLDPVRRANEQARANMQFMVDNGVADVM